MESIKGIILAGGTGTRLYPLTSTINKHLLPVGRYPMIFHPIYKLFNADIKEVLIVTGKEHLSAFAGLLGSGSDFGMEFTYRVQEGAGGIAQALGLGRSFAGNDRCVVLLGDNIFEDDISRYVEDFMKQSSGAKVLLKKVDDPKRYGIAELKEDRIEAIVEKPLQPKSDLCVTGIYMYDNRVFDIIERLSPSSRNELEITDVNNIYSAEGSLTYNILKGWWIDAGTIESLNEAGRLAADVKMKFQH